MLARSTSETFRRRQALDFVGPRALARSSHACRRAGTDGQTPDDRSGPRHAARTLAPRSAVLPSSPAFTASSRFKLPVRTRLERRSRAFALEEGTHSQLVNMDPRLIDICATQPAALSHPGTEPRLQSATSASTQAQCGCALSAARAREGAFDAGQKRFEVRSNSQPQPET